MKILKNKTYNQFKNNENSFRCFIIAIKTRLRDLEKQGKAKFIINEAGSGLSEWKLKHNHIIFNEFTDKFNGFSEFIVDNQRNADVQGLTTFNFLKILYK